MLFAFFWSQQKAWKCFRDDKPQTKHVTLGLFSSFQYFVIEIFDAGDEKDDMNLLYKILYSRRHLLVLYLRSPESSVKKFYARIVTFLADL